MTEEKVVPLNDFPEGDDLGSPDLEIRDDPFRPSPELLAFFAALLCDNDLHPADTDDAAEALDEMTPQQVASTCKSRDLGLRDKLQVELIALECHRPGLHWLADIVKTP